MIDLSYFLQPVLSSINSISKIICLSIYRLDRCLHDYRVFVHANEFVVQYNSLAFTTEIVVPFFLDDSPRERGLNSPRCQRYPRKTNKPIATRPEMLKLMTGDQHRGAGVFEGHVLPIRPLRKLLTADFSDGVIPMPFSWQSTLQLKRP